MKGGHVLAIVGPTASGKSALADLVAARLSTSVISVDAMQVYRGMDIGTAKTPEDARPVPLLMVDVADIGDAYSVQLFQRDARACADRLLDAGQMPVFCGGTGLYLNAVVDDMRFPKGDAASESRRRYEEMAEREGADAVHRLLEERDPASAALIHPNNVRRTIRALELLDEGKSYAVHHEGLHKREKWYEPSIWGIRMERERLYARIEERVDRMVAEGLVDEVRGLMDRGLGETLTAMQAIGYKEIVSALEGQCSMDEAVEEIKKRTRRYAKRQLSWFGHDPRAQWLDFDRLSPEEAADIVLASEVR